MSLPVENGCLSLLSYKRTLINGAISLAIHISIIIMSTSTVAASLESTLSKNPKAVSASAVTCEGLLIAESTKKNGTGLGATAVANLSHLAITSLKLHGALSPSPDRGVATATGQPASSSLVPIPYSQRSTLVAGENRNQLCLGTDDKAIVAATASSGFKGIVVETDKRVIRTVPLQQSQANDVATHNAAFLVVSELLE